MPGLIIEGYFHKGLPIFSSYPTRWSLTSLSVFSSLRDEFRSNTLKFNHSGSFLPFVPLKILLGYDYSSIANRISDS